MIYIDHREILYKNYELPILILSARHVKNYIGHINYALISIHDPSDYPVTLSYDNKRIAAHVESFRDVEDGSFGGAKFEYSITDEQALSIAQFVKRYKNNIKLLVVNCEAGMSRSAGVGAAISQYYNSNNEELYKYYTPNSTCYRKVYNALLSDNEQEIINKSGPVE